MFDALNWVNDLVCWFGQWFPRWGHCPVTHRGVKFKGHFLRGLIGQQKMTTKEFGPGIYFYWPVKTTVEKVPVKIHDIDLSQQSLTTRDNKPIMVHVVLLVRVSSVLRASTRTPDVDDILVQIGRKVVATAVGRLKWDALLNNIRNDKLLSEIQEEADARLRRFGVRVEEAILDDYTSNKVFTVLGSNELPVIDDSEDE